ncbi:MAG: MFS transporter, partial [Candidatus Bathyarchaeota archaeon]
MAKREWGVGMLRGNLLVLVVCRCIWMFSVSIPMSFLSLYIVELGGSAVTVGLVNSIATLTSLFLYPVGGYIADSRGRVKLVGVATAFFAFSFLPFAYAPNWQTVAVASVLQNLVLFYVPVLTAIQADSIPPGQRGSGFALTQAIPGAIGIASPYVGGYLIDTLGVLDACRLGFFVSFGAAIFVAVLRTFKLTETLNLTRDSIPLPNVLSLLKASYSSVLETLKWMPKSLRDLAILQVLYIFFHDLAAPFWILYGTRDVIGLSASEWGLLSLVAGALRFTIAIPAGKLI